MRFTQGLARHKIALLACGAVLCLLVALFGLSVTGIFKIPFLENAVSFVVTPVQGWISDAYASALTRRRRAPSPSSTRRSRCSPSATGSWRPPSRR